MDVPIVGRYCFCYRYNRCGVSCVRLFLEISLIIIQAQYPVLRLLLLIVRVQVCILSNFLLFADSLHGESDQSERKFSPKSLYLDLFPKFSGSLFG